MDLNLSIKQIFEEAKRTFKKSIILVSSFLTFSLIYLLFFYPPIFQSSATLVYSGSLSASMSPESSLNALGISLPGVSGTPNPEIIVQILNSDSFARKIVQEEFFSEKYSREIPLYKIILDDLEIEKTDTHLFEAKKSFKNSMLFVSKERLSNVISIVVESNESQLSYDIANRALDLLDEIFNSKEQQKANQKAEFILSRLKSEKQRLNDIEEEYIQFQNNNKSINQSPLLKMKEKSIERDLLVTTNVVSMLMQQLELNKIALYDELSEVMVISEPEMSPFRSNRRIFLLIGSLFASLALAGFELLRVIIINNKKESQND